MSEERVGYIQTGYTCKGCGQFVITGTEHHCPFMPQTGVTYPYSGSASPATQPGTPTMTIFTPPPDWALIETLLTRIAEALEHIEEKLPGASG